MRKYMATSVQLSAHVMEYKFKNHMTAASFGSTQSFVDWMMKTDDFTAVIPSQMGQAQEVKSEKTLCFVIFSIAFLNIFK